MATETVATCRAETVYFGGVTFRRYPESPRRSDRVYFTPGQADRMRGVGRLHEEIWKSEHGRPIPEGHHIHHADFDALNNDPANLVCLTDEEHREAHRERSVERGRKNPPSELALARAAEWHRSEEGRAWHREHGRRLWEKRQPTSSKCDQCGATYETLKLDDTTRFCSNACKSKWRRDAGLDDVERACEWCGEMFTANKYDKRRFCGRACSGRRRSAAA